jgi:hypothetical protein
MVQMRASKSWRLYLKSGMQADRYWTLALDILYKGIDDVKCIFGFSNWVLGVRLGCLWATSNDGTL